jgi:hypothetical protein
LATGSLLSFIPLLGYDHVGIRSKHRENITSSKNKVTYTEHHLHTCIQIVKKNPTTRNSINEEKDKN